jgi:hypothetical protein
MIRCVRHLEYQKILKIFIDSAACTENNQSGRYTMTVACSRITSCSNIEYHIFDNKHNGLFIFLVPKARLLVPSTRKRSPCLFTRSSNKNFFTESPVDDTGVIIFLDQGIKLFEMIFRKRFVHLPTRSWTATESFEGVRDCSVESLQYHGYRKKNHISWKKISSFPVGVAMYRRSGCSFVQKSGKKTHQL